MEHVVLMGEQSGSATHYVDSAQVEATALGRTPRALCRRTFLPAALAAPLASLCPACAAAQPAPARRRRRCRPTLRRTP